MSTSKETAYYMELQPGDAVQNGDQWRDSFGQWQPYASMGDVMGIVGHGVRARRPIGTTHQTALEEVPGSRTSRQAIDQPQRERIAYEELQPGDIIQEGDEWQHECGRWKPFASLDGSCVRVRHAQRARRPYNITAPEKYRTDLIDDIQHVIGERDEARAERDAARASEARLSTELWARKPLEERVASLIEELVQAREGNQQLLKTNAENADQFAEHTAALVQERDEVKAELNRLRSVVNCLYSEPTVRQVQDMLRTWATELDWAADCFHSINRDEIDTIQKTLIAVMERIDTLYPEGDTDGN